MYGGSERSGSVRRAEVTQRRLKPVLQVVRIPRMDD